MEVSPASATAMVKKLSELGLADHERYRGAVLTPAGERVAVVSSTGSWAGRCLSSSAAC